jgi:uncharacterized protein
MQALMKEEYAEMELEWLALQIRLGFKTGLLPGRKKIVCMAVRPGSELIDAHGYSYNCTEVSYVPAYGQPNLYATRLPETGQHTQSRNAAELSEINRQIHAGDREQCHSCRMLPVCGGQCPKAWIEGHAPCPSAKFNMAERLNVLYALNKMQALN